MTEWQPIETAPKNPEGEGIGPEILIWYEHSHTIYHAKWFIENGCGSWHRKETSIGQAPLMQHEVTHWMPSPQPPEAPNE